MPIRFACENPDCGKVMAAPDGSAGRKARCPACGRVQTIPAAPGREAPAPLEAPSGPSPFEVDSQAPSARPATASTTGGGRPVRSCPNCGAVYQTATCPRCGGQRKYTQARTNVGPYLTFAVLAVVVIALAVGIFWVMKQYAAGPLEYQRQVAQTPKTVQSVMTKANLAHIGKAIKMYSANGTYPANLEQLASAGMVPSAMLQSRTAGKTLAYVAGQSESSPGGNILVYEEQPGPDGRCDVLRISGEVESLSPDQLREALDQTRKQLERS